VDEKYFLSNGKACVTKIAIDPVWYLPEIAKRFNITEKRLRENLYEHTGRMYPELVQR